MTSSTPARTWIIAMIGGVPLVMRRMRAPRAPVQVLTGAADRKINGAVIEVNGYRTDRVAVVEPRWPGDDAIAIVQRISSKEVIHLPARLGDEEFSVDVGLAHDVLRALARHVEFGLQERLVGGRRHAANVASRLLTTFDGTVVGSNLRAESVLVMWRVVPLTSRRAG